MMQIWSDEHTHLKSKVITVVHIVGLLVTRKRKQTLQTWSTSVFAWIKSVWLSLQYETHSSFIIIGYSTPYIKPISLECFPLIVQANAGWHYFCPRVGNSQVLEGHVLSMCQTDSVFTSKRGLKLQTENIGLHENRPFPHVHISFSLSLCFRLSLILTVR